RLAAPLVASGCCEMLRMWSWPASHIDHQPARARSASCFIPVTIMRRDMPLPPGSRLGPYEILAPLGAGGMGEVFRARDTRLGREVAIKVLHSEAGLNAERRRRFEIEAQAASSLNHPNILSIYDIGEEQGLPYIVSELLSGESLREIIGRG